MNPWLDVLLTYDRPREEWTGVDEKHIFNLTADLNADNAWVFVTPAFELQKAL